jgi:RsiW-degrading membrane proteinase PrsW (M82 family)
MEISRKDMLINVGLWVLAIIIILLIIYDPLDILDLDQKVILVVIISAVLLPLLLYQRQRRILKKDPKNKMEISQKDRLLAMSITGMIIGLLIVYDPLDILDLDQKVILVVIISAVLLPLLLYQRQRIIKKTRRARDKFLPQLSFTFFLQECGNY